MKPNGKRSPAEKIRIFCRFFTGLRNVYGTYDINTGSVRQIKQQVDDEVIRTHLIGKKPYGVYLLNGDKIKSLAVDFDTDDLEPPLAFVASAKRYGISAYIERSKSKGHHVWIFFARGGVLARKARIVARRILSDIGQPQTEVFPKQDALNSKISYGNFINAPLFGQLVPKGRTIFVDPADPCKVYPDQWELLEQVHIINEQTLDAIIASLKVTDQHHPNENSLPDNQTEPARQISYFGLPPCARRILAEGVSSYQRITCFRLAVHLKRSGIPFDLAGILLKAWARKNQPADGKRIITASEIESQTRCAYQRSYRSFGCEDPGVATYCNENCLIYPRTQPGSSHSKSHKNKEST